jgi:hypothetical protein
MPEPEHFDLLRQGVEVWNAWRQKAPQIMEKAVERLV